MEDVVKKYLEGYSIELIAKQVGLGFWKTRGILLKAGVLRSRSESTKLAYEKGRRSSDHFRGKNKGSSNPSWKGGKINLKGYVRIWVPDHPSADNKGYVFEHRLVVEKHIGRYLKPDEHIHHIDGVKNNNVITNLQITNAKSHSSLTRHENRLRLWQNSATYALIRDHKEELEKMRKQGMSYQKITDALGVSPSAVKYAFKRNLDLSPSWTPTDPGQDKDDQDSLCLTTSPQTQSHE
jgi:hypothetical protein